MPSTTVRQRTVPLLAALIAVLAAVALITTAQSAHAAVLQTITVQPGTGTISALAAEAAPGDTLKLLPGTYHEAGVDPRDTGIAERDVHLTACARTAG